MTTTAPEAALLSKDLVQPLEGLAPPDRRFWFTPEMVTFSRTTGLPNPRFSVNTMAVVFFGRSASWLRMHMRPRPPEFPDGSFVLDGKVVVEPFRNKNDTRIFTLADVEPMAYALAQHGIIDTQRLVASVHICKWVARINGTDLEK